MLLTEDNNSSHFQIRDYQPGKITINDTTYKSSLIITPSTIITHWGPKTVDDISPEFLQPLIEINPNIILLGTGERFIILPQQQLAPLYQAGFSVDIMSTGAACRTFIALLLLFHCTCNKLSLHLL